MQNGINTRGQKRVDIKYGLDVGVVLKEDQSSGRLTYGKVQKILTNSTNHPHGIKVRLNTGEVGRVKEIL
ncbi:MAG: YwbE family protein [Sulfurovum sp.]